MTKKLRLPTTNLATPLTAQISKLGGLAEILARLESYASLGSHLSAELPEPMRAHVRFSSIDGQNLRYLADSSAWATKLRLLSSSLIAAAHRCGYPAITAVAIRVRHSA